MAIDTERKRFSMLTFGEDAPLYLHTLVGGFGPRPARYVLLGLYSDIAIDEFDATAIGSIGEPLELFRKIVARSKNWQRWVGADAENQIYLHANRSHIEVDGLQLWINDVLETPFIIIWMEDLRVLPQRCMNVYNLIFFVQDTARFRNDHNKSADYYSSQVGKVIDDLAADIKLTFRETLDCHEITMISPPHRVEVKKGRGLQADMWTSAFHLAVGPDV